MCWNRNNYRGLAYALAFALVIAVGAPVSAAVSYLRLSGLEASDAVGAAADDPYEFIEVRGSTAADADIGLVGPLQCTGNGSPASCCIGFSGWAGRSACTHDGR